MTGISAGSQTVSNTGRLDLGDLRYFIGIEEYNLQWAWTSGYLAGMAVANQERNAEIS